MTDQAHEAERLRALRNLNLLDTDPSEAFDRITRMASQLFKAPIAAVSLTDQDRQWFKSRVGCGTEIPRFKAPCAEVTRTSDVLVIDNMQDDCRFEDSLLVQNGIRFYAGAPLTTRDGYTLGAMCILDTEPRHITETEAKVLTDLAAMVMAQIELQHAFGRIDPASGLPNRNQFCEDVYDMQGEHRGQAKVAVLVDLVDARLLSRSMRIVGPSYLDDLLRQSIRTVETLLPHKTTIYHVGTTQLAAIITEEETHALNEALTHLLDAASRDGVTSQQPGMKMGLFPFSLGEVSPADILRSANAAAQDARDAGLAVASYSSSLDEAHRRRFAILAALSEALTSEDQLSLLYQPRVDTRTGRCSSVEALLRWHHPDLGSVSPGEFIPLAEHSEMSKPVTEWVLRSALAQNCRWRERGLQLRTSVNVSAFDLEDETFSSRVRALLEEFALVPQALEIEFTESALITNPASVIQNIKELKQQGIICAIDDFGTGYSSFSYLKDIPAEIIKIDQSFIRTLAPGDRNSALVRNMVSMANELGYRVVGEGVETSEALAYLRDVGCSEAQGYYISRPIPQAALFEFCRMNAAQDSRCA